MYHLPNEILKKYLDPFELGTSTRPSPNDPAVSMRNLACMFKNAALVGLPIEPLLEVVQDILHNDESAPKDKEAMLSQFMKNLVKDIKLLEFQNQMAGNAGKTPVWHTLSRVLQFLTSIAFPDPDMKSEE